MHFVKFFVAFAREQHLAALVCNVAAHTSRAGTGENCHVTREAAVRV